MRILLINDYDHFLGGAEKAYFLLKELLEENGHDVHTFTSRRTEQVHGLQSFFNVGSYLALKRLLARKHFDIVHINKINQILSSSVLLALKGNPVVFHVHDFSYICPRLGVRADYSLCNNYMKNWSLHRNCTPYYELSFSWIHDIFKMVRLWHNRWLIRRHVDSLICGSEQLSNLMQEVIGTGKNNFYTIPNYSSPLKAKRKPKRRKYLLFVGRISKEKGIDVLFKALRKLEKEGVSLPETLLAGEGPLLDHYKRLAARLHLDKVRFLGRIDNKELDVIYQEALAVVMPSVWLENLPLVALEAMRNDTAIICSRVGGYSDLVEHGKTGFLYAMGDYNAMADHIKSLLSQTKAVKMGLAGKQRLLERFNKENYYKRIMDVYETTQTQSRMR